MTIIHSLDCLSFSAAVYPAADWRLLESEKKMTIRNKILSVLSAVLAAATLCACDAGSGSSSDSANPGTIDGNSSDSPAVNVDYKYEQELNIIDDNYRNYYEIFVYSFCDSNGDGIGDLKGITSKLDYIKDMGFNGIWLTPIMPSTTYHKYDVTDYYGIDPQFGTMDDFDELVSECSKRGIKLILDLVMNHSSSQHPWFIEAKSSLNTEPCGAPANADCLNQNEICPTHNKYVNYYNFSEEQNAGYSKLNDKYFYECPFWDQMPDLNLNNEDVRHELEDIAKFWLDKGVGGFRLDAAKEYVSGDIKTNTEILGWFSDYCKSVDPNVYLVAEVWEQYTTFSKYYASEIPSIFDYSVGTQSGVIAKVLTDKSYTVSNFVNSMVTLENKFSEYYADAIDAPFISNHDNGRNSGIFSYDETKIKAGAGLLMTMTGSPFVYYGEEIGLTGGGTKDENYRAPMIWDSNGTGSPNPPSGMDSQNQKFLSVEDQLADPNSILNYYKRAARIRNENPEIARGKTVKIDLGDDKNIAAIERSYNGKTITIVYNYNEEEREITDSALNLGSKQIRGYLTTDASQEVTLDNGTLKIPAYGIAFLM